MTVSAWVYVTSFPSMMRRSFPSAPRVSSDTSLISPRTPVLAPSDSSSPTAPAGRCSAMARRRCNSIPGTTSPASTTLRTQNLGRLSQRCPRQRPAGRHGYQFPAEFDGQCEHRPSCGQLPVSNSPAALTMCASPITRSRKRRSRPTWQRRSAEHTAAVDTTFADRFAHTAGIDPVGHGEPCGNRVRQCRRCRGQVSAGWQHH